MLKIKESLDRDLSDLTTKYHDFWFLEENARFGINDQNKDQNAETPEWMSLNGLTSKS